MIIFGKAEREKFESNKTFSNYVVNTYNDAKVYYDGKWVMFSLPNKDLENDFLAMLAIKRKPNRK